MKQELILPLISTMFALAAFVFSLIAFLTKRKDYRKELTYRMLLDLNSLFVQQFEKVFITGKEKNFTPIQSVHAALNINFIESVYRMKLQNDSFLKPAILSLLELYHSWYEENKQFYSLDFQSYVDKQYAFILKSKNDQ